MISELDLQKGIDNLKKTDCSSFSGVISELKTKKISDLKKTETALPKNFTTEEIKIFVDHSARLKSSLSEKFGTIQVINERLLNDARYVKHLRCIRNFKFENKTHLNMDHVLPKEEFMYDIERSNFKLKKVYDGDFYILKNYEIQQPQPRKNFLNFTFWNVR